MSEWPGDDTPASFSFQGESSPSPTPLAAVTLCAFLAADSLERWGEVIWAVWRERQAQVTLDQSITPWHPWLPTAVLWATVHGTLAALVWVRTPWSRALAAFMLLAHILYLGQILAIKQPDLWIYMSELGRARVLVTTLVDAVALGWLWSRPARSYLDVA